jgi:hypothetical protein
MVSPAGSTGGLDLRAIEDESPFVGLLKVEAA